MPPTPIVDRLDDRFIARLGHGLGDHGAVGAGEERHIDAFGGEIDVCLQHAGDGASAFSTCDTQEAQVMPRTLKPSRVASAAGKASPVSERAPSIMPDPILRGSRREMRFYSQRRVRAA